MAYSNPEDQKRYTQKHYLRNKALYKKRARQNSAVYIQRNRKFVQRYKLFCGCQQCGFKKHHAAMDLHHLADKDKAIGRLVSNGVSMKILKKEMRKCIVLCANCHRITHSK